MASPIPNTIKETAKCFIVKSFEDAGVSLPPHAANHRIIKVKCPFCTPSGKSTNGKSLNVSIIEGFAKCHRAGCVLNDKILRLEGEKLNVEYKKEYYVPIVDLKLPLLTEHSKYLLSRGLQMDTLQKYGIVSSDYGGGKKITFPYLNGDGSMSFLKYRGLDKSFGMSKSPKLIFFGLQHLDNKIEYLNIFEGEIDCLSAVEAGVKNCISVPNGAGAGLEYFDNSIGDIIGFERYIIWSDNDAAGEVLKAALIQRIGAFRCQLVTYPEGCKDANDILMKHGKNGILTAFSERFAAPIEGVYDLSNKRLYLDDLRKNGRKGGYKLNSELGIDIWKPMVGETTFIVGAPNSGKTTIIANIALWLAVEHGLKFLIVSPEDGDVGNYMYKQIQMIANKWYFPYQENTDPSKILGDDEDAFCRDFLDKNFTYLDAANFDSVDNIFDTIQGVNFEKGLFGVILDPFNSLPSAYSLDAAKQNELMANICNRTRKMGICTIIGAHPNTIRRDKDGRMPAITFADIQGGAAVSNKVDNLLFINRVTPKEDDEFAQPHTTVEAIKIKLQPLNGETYRQNVIYYDAYSKSGFFSAQANSQCKRQPLFEWLRDGKVKELSDQLFDDGKDFSDAVPF